MEAHVTDPAKSTNGFSIDDSARDSGAFRESILCTEELTQRPWRPPDYENENRGLVALAGALADSQSDILQILADTILDVTQCDSSGLSLLTKEDGQRFYWPAIAGIWKPHIGGGTPRDFGPCADVLDQNRTLLFQHFERRYPYLLPIHPPAEECLLVPFYVGDRAAGTIWAIMHSDRRKFDAEDHRIMSTLGRFAALAYQTLASLEDLKLQIAAREKAEAALRELVGRLETKVRRLVDSNIIGIFIWGLDGRITDANDAFLRMVGYGRDDVISGGLRWRELTPAEFRDADNRREAELTVTGIAQPYEKEYFHRSGYRVPVLVRAARFEDKSNEGVAFVIDLTDRKRAEEAASESDRRYREVEMELAHTNRVAGMGQLSASIAHEIRQPVAATVTNAQAALRWLAARPPELEEVRQALSRIVGDAARASEVAGRIHSFIQKTPLRKEAIEINGLILETIALTRGEAVKHGISVHAQFVEGLPLVQGDRVQLQQVIFNLMMNAIEAMSGVRDGPRELLISTEKAESDDVLVAVRDSGPGLSPASLGRLFEAFYTTKSSGLGMGLSICRSIVEAHGGQLWATANVPHGALFQFAVPTRPNVTS
jgi:PAS domain S-box-containing protein